MNLKDALQERRSIRKYKDRPIEQDLVESILEMAETAPSAGNLRAREYVVVTRPEIKPMLSVAAYGQEHVAKAPVLIVVCADPMKSKRRYGDRGHLYCIQDAASAATCILLAACDVGLGTCWTGAFDDEAVKDVLGIPERLIPTAIICLGWPDEKPTPPPGKDMAEAVYWVK